jgi:hypothetical protein
MNSDQLDQFDSYLNAQRDYQLYKGWTEIDETENLPSGIYASIVRWEPLHPLEEEEEEVDEPPTDLAETAETMMEF